MRPFDTINHILKINDEYNQAMNFHIIIGEEGSGASKRYNMAGCGGVIRDHIGT